MKDGELFKLESWGPREIFGAAIVVFVTTLLLSWISQFLGARRHGSRRLPPGPRGWPLIGALPYVGEFPHKSLYELSKKYGPVMYMRLGSISALVVSNGEMAKEVLQHNDQICASRPGLLTPAYLTYGQDGLAWSPYGHHWQEVRKAVKSKLLTSASLSIFTKIVKGEILSTIHTALQQSQSSGKQTVNITSGLKGMAMNIMTRMMWNNRHRNIDESHSQSSMDTKIGKLVVDVMHLASSNIVDFLPPFLQPFAMRMSGLAKKTEHIHEEFDSFWEGIIREKEQAPALGKETKATTDEDDFVDVLLKLMNQPAEGSQPISREDVKAVLLDMITGGTDTTSVILDCVLAQLLKRPDIMKKAQDELMTVVGVDRLVNESDIPNLKYLDVVVKEGFRAYNPAPLGLPHFSEADCKVGGYDVPAKTTVFINIFAIHHDSTVWESPWEFNPDRFLNSDKNYKGQNYNFIPFSSGRRMCPGINFASAVVHICLAQFLHTTTWSLPKGQALEDVDMTQAPGTSPPRATPLFVNAKPRLAHHVIYPQLA